MSDRRRERCDTSSGSGHGQAVADSGTYSEVQRAYHALLEHSLHCANYRSSEGRCEPADGRYRAWRRAGGPHGH